MLKKDAIRDLELILFEARAVRGAIHHVKSQKDKEYVMAAFDEYAGKLLAFAVAFKSPRKRNAEERPVEPGGYIDRLYQEAMGQSALPDVEVSSDEEAASSVEEVDAA